MISNIFFKKSDKIFTVKHGNDSDICKDTGKEIPSAEYSPAL